MVLDIIIADQSPLEKSRLIYPANQVQSESQFFWKPEITKSKIYFHEHHDVSVKQSTHVLSMFLISNKILFPLVCACCPNGH